MKLQAIIFDDEKDLQELTGLNHDQLWDAGFDLDDWDFGIVTDEIMGVPFEGVSRKPVNIVYYKDLPACIQWMFDSCFCARNVEYNGKHYTMAYHS